MEKVFSPSHVKDLRQLDKPANEKIVQNKWVFEVKREADGIMM